MPHKALRIALLHIVGLSILLASIGTAHAGLFSKKDAELETPLTLASQETLSNAQQLVQDGKLDEAIQLADKAIAFDRKSGMPYMVKAIIFKQKGDSKKAWQMHKKAISLSPANGYVLNAAGVHACSQGRVEEADALFMRAVADPRYDMPHQAMENAGYCALGIKQNATAENRYRSALALNQNAVLALEGMAFIHFEKSEYMQARAFLQRRESLGLLSANLLELAIKIEKAAGDDRAAAKYQKQFDQLVPLSQAPVGEGQLSQ